MYLLHDRPNRPDFSGKSIAVPQIWPRVVSPCSPQLHAPPVLLTQCTRIIVVAGYFARPYPKLSLSSSLIFSLPNHEFDVRELLADELLTAEPNPETPSSMVSCLAHHDIPNNPSIRQHLCGMPTHHPWIFTYFMFGLYSGFRVSRNPTNHKRPTLTHRGQ